MISNTTFLLFSEPEESDYDHKFVGRTGKLLSMFGRI